MSDNTLRFSECVVSVFGYHSPNRYSQLLGTGFRLGRPNLIVTAKHVIEKFNTCVVGARRQNESGVIAESTRIITPPDPNADLAVIELKDSGTWQHFVLPPSNSSPVLGSQIASYGYPVHEKKQLTPRMMFGHVQRIYTHVNEDRQEQYAAYELGFPSFGGQSGSPVFSNEMTPKARLNVLAVVTNSIVYRQSSEPIATSASWAVGLTLAPFTDWLNSI